MLLMQSSQDKRFIDLLQEAINHTESDRGMTAVLEHIAGTISAAEPEQRLEMLQKWSKSGQNLLLWQHLSPETLG